MGDEETISLYDFYGKQRRRRKEGERRWVSFCALPRRCDVSFTYSGSVSDVSRKKDLERLLPVLVTGRRTISTILVRLKYHSGRFLCLPWRRANNSAASVWLKRLLTMYHAYFNLLSHLLCTFQNNQCASPGV